MPIFALAPLAVLLLQQPAPSAPSLDFQFFKERIQPIFTTKRDGNSRCVSCHIFGTPMRLQPLAAGSVLCVTATDTAAPVDLPAWCGLTGQRLLSARPPLYWIEKRPRGEPR